MRPCARVTVLQPVPPDPFPIRSEHRSHGRKRRQSNIQTGLGLFAGGVQLQEGPAGRQPEAALLGLVGGGRESPCSGAGPDVGHGERRCPDLPRGSLGLGLVPQSQPMATPWCRILTHPSLIAGILPGAEEAESWQLLSPAKGTVPRHGEGDVEHECPVWVIAGCLGCVEGPGGQRMVQAVPALDMASLSPGLCGWQRLVSPVWR